MEALPLSNIWPSFTSMTTVRASKHDEDCCGGHIWKDVGTALE